MIDAERINSQLSLSHAKTIAFVDPWGGGGRLTIDAEKSTVNFHFCVKR